MRKTRGTEKIRSKGFDFGSRHYSVHIGGNDFIQALKDAEVFAIAYAETYVAELGGFLRTLMLVAKTADPLASAFKTFESWTNQSGTQGVELTFVFLRNGGYVLGISPRPESLARRLGAFNSPTQPLLVGATWSKKFDSRHSFLDDLRVEHQSNLIAPFLLEAGFSPSAPAFDSVPQSIRPIPNLKPLLIFRATFADEADVDMEKSTTASIVLGGWLGKDEEADSKGKVNLMPPLENSPSEYVQRRARLLETFFPVTLERVRTIGWFRDAFSSLMAEGARPWQIEQALCNLALSSDICDRAFHYPSIPSSSLPTTLLQSLPTRFEEADGGEALRSRIDPTVIRNQIILDGMALLREHNITATVHDLGRLQRLLDNKQLLDNKS